MVPILLKCLVGRKGCVIFAQKVVMKSFARIWSFIDSNFSFAIGACSFGVIAVLQSEVALCLRKLGAGNGDVMQELISNSLILQLIISLVLFLFGMKLVHLVWSTGLDWKRGFVWGGLAYLIQVLPIWRPVVLYGGFLLHHVFVLFLLIACVLEFIKYKRPEPGVVKSGKGRCFVPIGQYDEVDSGWVEYAETLKTMIDPDVLRREGMGIGISGEWGSGKTTFLTQLKRTLGGSFEVVEFNPWICDSAEKVKTDFFNTLDAHFGKNVKLSGAIQTYAELLAEVEWGLGEKLLNFLFGKRPGTLSEKKEQVEHLLEEPGQLPVAILVDDMDRLEAEEAFEVLRLIRITANFRNVVFFVTYDKTHLCEMLKEKGIQEGSRYIEKIFNLEISLPLVDSTSIPRVVLSDVRQMVGLDEQQERELLHVAVIQKDKSPQWLLTDYIRNFRQARRFATVLALNINQMARRGLDEYLLRDIFLLELLHYAFPAIYKELCRSPYTLLRKETDNLRFITRFVVKEEVEENPIMALLFPKYIHGEIDRRSVCFHNSYGKYFCYRVPARIIPYMDFDMLMHSDDSGEVERRVREWGKNHGLSVSLAAHLEDYPLWSVSPDVVVRNYVRAVVLVTDVLPVESLNRIFFSKFRTSCCHLRHKEFVKQAFSDAIAKHPSPRWSRNLYEIISECYEVDGWEEREYEQRVLTYDEVKSLMVHNLRSYVSLYGRPDILCLANERSEFYQLVYDAAHRVLVYPETGENNGWSRNEIWGNPLGKELVNLYRGADSVNFKKFIGHFMPQDEPDNYDYELQHVQSEIERLFGTRQVFLDFISAAFRQTEEVKAYLLS